MISVERSFYEKFPRLAAGPARSFAQPVVTLLRRIACEERINAALAEIGELSGFAFVERVLERLDIGYRVANTDRENIPVEGRVVIVANHPLGALDALALVHLVGSVRRDVRILANDVLLQFKPLAPMLLPLPVFGSGNAVRGLREAHRALEAGQALIVFPAGEVSRMGARGIRDGAWSPGFVRLAQRSGAPVLPVHVAAQNSPMFYGVSMLARPLASLLLAREMFGAARARIDFQVGGLVPCSALNRDGTEVRRIAAHMRRHVYRLPRRRPAVFETSTAIAHPEPARALRASLASAETLGRTRDGKSILLVDAAADDPVLREIGRLREIAFRRVGEGTGSRRDIDRYDLHYRHLVLWDEMALAIVGAYRIGEVGSILRERGMEGLYSASLFEFAPEADAFLADSIELGRSFVQPAYWGSRSLDYLWQGIGAYLRARPQVRYLFGPVSLSAALPIEAREWIVQYHRHFHGDADGLARARNPFHVSDAIVRESRLLWDGRDRDEAFARLQARLQALGATIPVLYRQYVGLCEPEGIRFLDFGVDPAFAGCVDGLVRLELGRMVPAKRRRYVEDSRQVFRPSH